MQERDPHFLQRSVALGRLGTPQDLVGAAIFFASEASSYVTGEILGVNGGFVPYMPGGAADSW